MAARSSQNVTQPSAPTLRVARQRHRDDLRSHVLDAAAAIIAAEGAEALSMRKLAHALHCAPMTLYSYFGDKHELLLALAHRSFDALATRLAANPADPPLEALRGLYLAYARFGLERPDEYRTIFMTPEAQPPRARKTPDQMPTENPAFAAGLDLVRTCVADGSLSGDPHAIATLLWTATHGAVAAILTFPAFPFGDPATYLTRTVDLLIVALKMKATAALV